AVVAEADQFDRVPLASRLLVIGLFDTAAGRALALREKGPFPRWVVLVVGRRSTAARLRAHGNDRADGVEVADVVLLDLQLDRARPRPSFGSRLCVNVVQQSTVARRRRPVARRPLLLSPFELQLQVVV